MLQSNAPTKVPQPFAGTGTTRLPAANSAGITSPEQPSWDIGWPVITETAKAVGGIPPARKDFNGVLNFVSAALQYLQAGGSYKRDSTFSASIGGYPLGARVQAVSGPGRWISTTDNNTTDPDTGGAGWVYDNLAQDLPSTAAGKGASMVGVQDAADYYAGADVEAVLAEIAAQYYSVNLERYAALVSNSSGEARWDAAFAAAQAAAVAAKKPLYLGTGIKYFTTTWNCSANDTSKDGLVIFGAGTAFSKMVWRNTSGACLEGNGVDRLHLKDFQISGSCPVGIATGRSTVRQWGGHHWYENIRVIMNDDMTMNSGIGSIALLGIEPEESCFDACEFWANLPVIICPPNNISVRTFDTAGSLATTRTMTWTPTYTPIITTLLSNTVFHFTGGCRLVAWQPDSPPLALRSASSIELGSSFLQIRGGGSNPSGACKKNPYAIDAENVWNLRWFGTGERGTDDSMTDVGALLMGGSAENWTVSANAGTANSATLNYVPAIYVIDSTSAVHRNLDIKLRLNSNQAQYPIRFSNGSGSSIKIENSDYRISSTASIATLQQSFLYNMSNSRISLSPANATVPVVLEHKSRYRSEIQAAKTLPYATATTVATCTLPLSGISSGTLMFRNVVLNAGFLGSGSQVALMTGEFDVSWTRTAATTALTVTVTRSSFASSVKTLSSSLDISAPTISAVLSGQTSFDVQITANLSGTSASGTSTWFGADVISSASIGVGASIATVTTQ